MRPTYSDVLYIVLKNGEDKDNLAYVIEFYLLENGEFEMSKNLVNLNEQNLQLDKLKSVKFVIKKLQFEYLTPEYRVKSTFYLLNDGTILIYADKIYSAVYKKYLRIEIRNDCEFDNYYYHNSDFKELIDKLVSKFS